MYSFLSALPAILGFVCFVVCQFLAKHAKGDAITKRLLEKVRREAPDLVQKYEGLPTAKREHLIANDQQFRKHISEQDFQLLQQTLRNQFRISLVVYISTALLVVIGAALFTLAAIRPEPTRITDLSLVDTHEQARDYLVDLDTLKVTWHSRGQPSDVYVYIENLEDGQRSNEKKVESSQESVLFAPNEYLKVLKLRSKGSVNRVRVGVRNRTEAAMSVEFPLRVGIKISILGTEEKIKVMARIDNQPIHFYDFEAKVVIPRKSGVAEFLTLDGFKYGANDRPISRPEDLEWNDIRLAYFGPDDSRIVRPEFLGLAVGGR